MKDPHEKREKVDNVHREYILGLYASYDQLLVIRSKLSPVIYNGEHDYYMSSKKKLVS